jgi:hypothetical protein
MNDDFYIGWEGKAPPAFRRTRRGTVAALLVLAVALATLFAVAQRTIGVSVFEWGTVKSFTGVLRSQPYPHLLVPRPGAAGGEVAFSTYHLVRPFKFGLEPEISRRFDGRAVSLKGTLIYRDNQTMIEVPGDSIRDAPEASKPAETTSRPASSLGRQTLVGEIVDSKCYLGVMNPGQLTPHRACAIRCISGGIPPVLLVRQTNGPALYFLLVAPDGRPVNQQVLPLVAEPVQITGEVERQGELLILRSDPATYRRVHR